MTTGLWLTSVGLVILGYLVGSVSPSVFLGRAFKGIDVRKVGSGNAGTTNAFRALGVRLGIAVLLGDLLKGAVPVVVARLVLHDEHPAVIVLVAFASVLGHNYSIFLRGKGGKGVATGAGAALALMPIPMAIVVGIFIILSAGRADSVDRVHRCDHHVPGDGGRVPAAARVYRRRVRHGGRRALGAPGQLPPPVEAPGATREVRLDQAETRGPRGRGRDGWGHLSR